MENFRRHSWTPRQIGRPISSKTTIAHSYLPGEFPEPRSAVLVALRRAVGLTSDITLLLLLSPFFAGWFVYRGLKRLQRSPR